MCWVIPPASPATTLVERIRSSSSVLPWSTWPITVTTGGRGRSSDSASSSSSSSKNLASSSASRSSPGSTRRTSAPSSAANSSIMSSVSDWVAVTISPCSSRKRITSPAERLSFGPRSRAVEPRSTMTSVSGTGAVDGV